MMKNQQFCADHRRPTPTQGLTTRQWGLELPLQDTAVGMSTSSAKPNQGKQGGSK